MDVRMGRRSFKRKPGATVLTLHHTLKRTTKSKPVAERGSGALRGAVDTMMAVVKKGSTLHPLLREAEGLRGV